MGPLDVLVEPHTLITVPLPGLHMHRCHAASHAQLMYSDALLRQHTKRCRMAKRLTVDVCHAAACGALAVKAQAVCGQHTQGAQQGQPEGRAICSL